MAPEATFDYQTQIAHDALRYALEQRRGSRLWKWIRRQLRAPLAGSRVLVVGAGRGKDCTYFVEFGAREVHGLDIADDLGADFQHPRVRYHACSAEQMPFASGSFDLVYSVATMEHIPDIARAFSEMVRVTRPGGLTYCFAAPLWNAHDGHHLFKLWPEMPWIHLRLSRDEMIAYSRRVGTRPRGDYDISVDVDFVFSSYFNRVPASRYVEVCARLPVSRLLANDLVHDAPDKLPDDVYRELAARYSREELLSQCHKFVAVK